MVIKIVLTVIAAYMFGSLNFAIIITRLVRGEDIRTLGNKNPGASNTGRTVGRLWGFVVLVLDALKAVIPMAVAGIWIFNGGTALDDGALYLMGIAAVAGHIFPLWYGFRGGGGVSTMQGVSLWFIPVEYLATMLVSGFLALGFFRHKGLWLTQWTPILFITLTPFVTLVVNRKVDLTIWKGITLGGHSWTVVAGCFVLSLMMMGLNIRLLAAKITGKTWEKHLSV